MSDEDKCPGIDAVCPLGVVNPDGSVPVIHHTRDHNFQMGELRPLQDGKPITGKLVQLEGDATIGEWHQMKPVLRDTKSGPAMINSKEFRDGWTNIFGHQTYGQA